MKTIHINDYDVASDVVETLFRDRGETSKLRDRGNARHLGSRPRPDNSKILTQDCLEVKQSRGLLDT